MMKTTYHNQENVLKKRIEELQQAQIKYSKDYHLDEKWEDTVQQYINKRKLTKEMVDAFVSRITVDGQRNIEVKLIYDDFLMELEKIKNERMM